MARKRNLKRINEASEKPNVGKTIPNNPETLGIDVTSKVKVGLLILIILGIVAFLFYPDIVRVASLLSREERSESKAATKNVKSETIPNDQSKAKDSLHSQDKRFKTENRKEDLMESEILEGEAEEESELIVEDAEVNVEDTELKEPKTDEGKSKEESKSKQPKNDKSKSKEESGPIKFKVAESDGKGFINLNRVKDGNLKLEEAEEKTVTNVKPKRKEETKKKEGAKKGESDLPSKIKDFKPQYQKTVTAKKIFADGRRIPPIELIPQKPTNSSVRVFLFDEFLSNEECDGLRNAHDRHVQESSKESPILCFDSFTTLKKHLKDAKKKLKITPNVFTHGTTCVNASFSEQLTDWFKGNWSFSTAFYPGENRFSHIFAHRVKEAMGLNPGNGGKIQLTSYPVGKAYKSHTDCALDSKDQRDRVASVLVYLQDVEKGGETKFPELGIWVKPRKGRALVWNNMDEDGKCEPHSIHTASKVDEGHKYILIRWYYYKSFYSLGKRPPEPELPPRHPGQPRVSCDEYEYGSCRWYDEWSYEHLLEYEKLKFTLI